VATYSSGMRSRIGMAVSMAVDFDCYLIDEAFSVGDGIFRARAEAVLESKFKKASLVLVSHSVATVRRLCNMGAVMWKGDLRLYDDLEDAIQEYQRVTNNMGTYE